MSLLTGDMMNEVSEEWMDEWISAPPVLIDINCKLSKDVNCPNYLIGEFQLEFDQLWMTFWIMHVEYALCIIQSSNFSVKYL